MVQYRVNAAALMVGVGEDAFRRWISRGGLPSDLDTGGRMVVDGADLAMFLRDHPGISLDDSRPGDRSARNHMVGLVTSVVSDLVMAQVEIQAGPHRVVSVMSSEAARELHLEPGSLAVAVIKSTDVIIETPTGG
ncbi:TOBE domain-containing protein [Pseudonocardia sp. HH130629-09]|uniref:TOBE domain-containing protein n=1 Tax=Pseudonocardia sp. HH130629-09 TaxID=1641402 RepID=UPI0006CB421F|nr:TOBE domain-containing protein [Pseudonocardia sp. HH130629-09]ALE84487.1 MerR family transcriptional regulator [Pseudonocardia sp. HH130629-09]